MRLQKIALGEYFKHVDETLHVLTSKRMINVFASCVFFIHTVVKYSEHVIAHFCDTRYTEPLTQEYTT